MIVALEPVQDPTPRRSKRELRARPGGPVEMIQRASGNVEPVGMLDLHRVADDAPASTPFVRDVLRRVLHYAKPYRCQIDGKEVVRFAAQVSARQIATEVANGRGRGKPYSLRWVRHAWGELQRTKCVHRQLAPRFGANTWIFSFEDLERAVYGEDAPDAKPADFDVRRWMPPASHDEAVDAQRVVVEVVRRVLGDEPAPADLRKAAPGILSVWRRLRDGKDGAALTVDQALERLDQALEATRSCTDVRWDWFRGVDDRRGRRGGGFRGARPGLDQSQLPSAVFGLCRSEKRWMLVHAHSAGACACHAAATIGGDQHRSRVPPPARLDELVRGILDTWVTVAADGEMFGLHAPRIRLLVDAGRRDELVDLAVRRRRALPYALAEGGDIYWPAPPSTAEDLVRWVDRLAGELEAPPGTARAGP